MTLVELELMGRGVGITMSLHADTDFRVRRQLTDRTGEVADSNIYYLFLPFQFSSMSLFSFLS